MFFIVVRLVLISLAVVSAVFGLEPTLLVAHQRIDNVKRSVLGHTNLGQSKFYSRRGSCSEHPHPPRFLFVPIQSCYELLPSTLSILRIRKSSTVGKKIPSITDLQ